MACEALATDAIGMTHRDGATIDGLGPDGVSARVIAWSGVIVRLQTGYLYHYAFAMLIGVAALITYYLLGGVH